MSVFAPEAVNALLQIISNPEFMKRKEANEVNQSSQADQAISDQSNSATQVNDAGNVDGINRTSQVGDRNESEKVLQIDDGNEETSENDQIESVSESPAREAGKENCLQTVEQI